ncbi:hypothetical protein Tco_0133178 [Tanacetum coccineum]
MASLVVRSSLEEMLESLQRNESKQTDLPPALPSRPGSKARLPKRPVPSMFGGAQEVKGNGSFGRKEVMETVACSESPYTMADVHECRLAENGGAGLATAPRSLDSGWDKSIEYYIKKSRMELYMLNRPHGRMILASVEKGPLVWPSITVDGVTRLKEYIELTPAEAIQADCDIKAINIILQGLPT